jgi:hypothetical protein
MPSRFKNPRVFGATLVGGALVLGAVILNNLSSNLTPVTARIPEVAKASAITIPERTFVPVTDSNDDGVEDWREEFIIQAPIELPPGTSSTTFEMPTTVTDQVGLQVFQSFLQTKAGGGQFNQTSAETISKTASKVSGLAVDTLYTASDIITVPTDPIAIRRYGNTMGQSLITHNVTSDGELEIMMAAIQSNDAEKLKELQPLALMYQKLRDDALNTPVPERFAEDHLNLINAYHTLYRDITDFQLIFNDPLVALLRIKRYQDDATALAIILNTMYRNAAPFASLFTEDDPAMVFSVFAN